MNEVRSKAKGILRVVENRQRIAKNKAIAVAQNNASGRPPKRQEEKDKVEEKQQRYASRFD